MRFRYLEKVVFLFLLLYRAKVSFCALVIFFPLFLPSFVVNFQERKKDRGATFFHIFC